MRLRNMSDNVATKNYMWRQTVDSDKAAHGKPYEYWRSISSAFRDESCEELTG